MALHALEWHFAGQAPELQKFAERFEIVTSDGALSGYRRVVPNAAVSLIFVHGTPAQAGIWHAQFQKPFPGANLIAIDRPGFGNSTPALKRPSLDEQVSTLLPLLTNSPPERTILIGHSYGGPVALLTALKHPGKVSAVVLVGGSVDPAQERTFIAQQVAEWPVFNWLLPRSLRQCNRELLTLRQDLVELKKLLPSLRVPIVMLHGGRDRQVPIANVTWLKYELADVGKGRLFTAMVREEYSHFIPWEHPEAVEQAIGEALKK